jgi:CubicO group peptidase (beta-lactamase class C family)
MTDQGELQVRIKEAAEEHSVPGVAVGVYREGEEQYAFHGVTSIENPLPVDENTLFQFGSTGKTYTATAIMRLVEQGQVKLEEKVRTYVPELKLKDEDVAREVTVLNLLNHTAGWQGDFLEDTGPGDDAVAKFVERMAGIDQEFPLGKTASYNNASFTLAGRIIEKVTGKTYEEAIRELLLEPLGLDRTFFFPDDIITYKFAVGHENHEDGSLAVSRPWGETRSGNPMGGMSSPARDQIAWAKFHLGDGTGVDGKRVLSRESLELMREPTTRADGAALGDYVGISWMILDVDGVRTFKHGGSTNGQQSAFHMVPERDFAIAVLTNASPNGIEAHVNIVRWAYESYLGLVQRDPEPVDRSEAELAEYVGDYERIDLVGHVTIQGGGLVVIAESKDESAEGVDELPPFPLGMLAERDKVIVLDGPFKSMQGVFTRDEAGTVDGLHFGGRLMLKA